MIVLVVLFASLSFFASKLLGPRRPTSAKQAPSAWASVPTSRPAARFPVRFYLVATAFIALPVESLSLPPLSSLSGARVWYGLIIMGFFLVILLVARPTSALAFA